MWDTIMGLLPLLTPYVPVNTLAIIGGVALVGTGVSKPKSQYNNKLEFVFQTVLKYLGGNFGKSANKE